MINKFNDWLKNLPVCHRGLLTKEFYENSQFAFKNAIDNNFPIETDIQMTADGVLICFHDNDFNRYAQIDKKICEVDFKFIKNLNKSKQQKKILTFEEFLRLVDGKVPLLIEIKPQVKKGIEQKVVNTLKNYSGKFAIQSFNPFIIKKIKRLAPTFSVGILITNEYQKVSFIKKTILNNLLYRPFLKFDFLSVNINCLQRYRRKFKNKLILTWTIDNKEKFNLAKKFADNVIFENISTIKPLDENR